LWPQHNINNESGGGCNDNIRIGSSDINNDCGVVVSSASMTLVVVVGSVRMVVVAIMIGNIRDDCYGGG